MGGAWAKIMIIQYLRTAKHGGGDVAEGERLKEEIDISGELNSGGLQLQEYELSCSQVVTATLVVAAGNIMSDAITVIILTLS